jgi:hypothetical protein
MKSKVSIAVVLLFLAGLTGVLLYTASKLDGLRANTKHTAATPNGAPALPAKPGSEPSVATATERSAKEKWSALQARLLRGEPSALTVVDEPEVEDAFMALPYTKAGMKASFAVSNRVFSRDGKKVAVLRKVTEKIEGSEARITRGLQFWIDDDNWAILNLDNPSIVQSHFAVAADVTATADSVSVDVPSRDYVEVYFKSTGQFMDGEVRLMWQISGAETRMEKEGKK